MHEARVLVPLTRVSFEAARRLASWSEKWLYFILVLIFQGSTTNATLLVAAVQPLLWDTTVKKNSILKRTQSFVPAKRTIRRIHCICYLYFMEKSVKGTLYRYILVSRVSS